MDLIEAIVRDYVRLTVILKFSSMIKEEALDGFIDAVAEDIVDKRD